MLVIVPTSVNGISIGNDFETIVVDRVGYEFSGIGENYQSHGGGPL